MKKLYAVSAVLIIVGALSACVKQEPEEDAIPQGYKRSLEKAEGVEKTLQDTAMKRLENVDKANQ